MKKLKFWLSLIIALVTVVSSVIVFKRKLERKTVGVKVSWRDFFSADSLSFLTSVLRVREEIPTVDDTAIRSLVKFVSAVVFCISQIDDLDHEDEFVKFARKNDLVLNTNSLLPQFLIGTKLKNSSVFEEKFIQISQDIFVSKYVFPDGDTFFLKEATAAVTGEGVDRVGLFSFKQRQRSYHFGAINKDFDIKRKLNAFWTMYNNGIYVSINNEPQKPIGNRESTLDTLPPVVINCLEPLPNFYIKNTDETDVSSFAETVKKFREKNIQRSYLLVGQPGTGKTIFCQYLAKELGGRCLVIDGSLLRATSDNVWEFIETLEPDVIVCDDFDRVFNDNQDQDVLKLLASFKTKPTFSKIVFMATVNHPERLGPAVIRPGRFDDIFWLDLPDKPHRKLFIEECLKENNVSLSKEELNTFVTITEGASQAYLKEYCLRLSIDKQPEKLFARIKLTHEALKDNMNLQAISLKRETTKTQQITEDVSDVTKN